MQKLLEILGELIDAILGPSTTTTTLGPAKFETHTVRQTVLGPDIDVSVRSRQIVYHTRYKRLWILNRHSTVYEVVGQAPEEYRPILGDRFFTPTTYPLLCHSLLVWTEYPHQYAINAFLDRALPSHLTTVKVKV